MSLSPIIWKCNGSWSTRSHSWGIGSWNPTSLQVFIYLRGLFGISEPSSRYTVYIYNYIYTLEVQPPFIIGWSTSLRSLLLTLRLLLDAWGKRKVQTSSPQRWSPWWSWLTISTILEKHHLKKQIETRGDWNLTVCCLIGILNPYKWFIIVPT